MQLEFVSTWFPESPELKQVDPKELKPTREHEP